jgi:hypothetical protein
VSDSLDSFKDLGDPESAMMIAVIDGAIHVAYSKDLTNKYEEMLDILETACIMISEAAEPKSNKITH